MQLLENFLPILIFLILYYWKGLFFATYGMLGLSILQLLWQKGRKKSIPKLNWFNFGLILCLGLMTVGLRNEAFIKWKPTLLYWSLAVVYLCYPFLYKKTLLEELLAQQANFKKIDVSIWGRLNWLWIAFFSILGGINLWVAYHFSTKIWVNFKFFGILGLLLPFIIIQTWYLSGAISKEEKT